MKSRLKSWTVYYHSVRNLLFSSLPSENIQIKTFRTVILSVVLYGCETWFFTLREEHRLRVLENMVLRKIFGPKRDEVTGHWRRLHEDGPYALYSSPNIIRVIKSRSIVWKGVRSPYEDRRGACRVLARRPDGRNHLEELDVDERIILKWIFKKWDEESWTGLLCLRTGTCSGRW